MRIQFHRHFEKKFRKLPVETKKKTISAIEKFGKNPHHPSLHNHPLSGYLKRKRAFSVTGDVRIIFEEYDGYILVIFLDVGTHNQVYS